MNSITQSSSWYVTLYKEEIEKCQTAAQLSVYAAIKSYTSNGKSTAGLSLRDIAKRCPLSTVWISEVLSQLTVRQLVFTVGKETRRGGTVNVYQVNSLNNKVLSDLTVNGGSVKPVNTNSGESVKSVESSVKSVASKVKQYNNINNYNNNCLTSTPPPPYSLKAGTPPGSRHELTPLVAKEMIEIALELHIDHISVELMAKRVSDCIDKKKYNITNFKSTLIDWLSKGIMKKDIYRYTDSEYEDYRREWAEYV